jgi:putative phosphoribosyl transferase
MTFRNREEAGRELALHLRAQKIRNPIVVALPRGGVPIAAEVALELQAPLDILIVKKLGAPDNPEYGIGAITEGNLYILHDAAMSELGMDPHDLLPILDRAQKEVKRRVSLFEKYRPHLSVKNRNVILVDDGLATGVTATVAVEYYRQQGASKIILATPVCARDSAHQLRTLADQVICLQEPDLFYAVGNWYQDFSQISDDQVIEILSQFSPDSQATKKEMEPVDESLSLGIVREVTIRDCGVELQGSLSIPPACSGIVLFAHGSGSSRFSPRNQQIAQALNDAQIGTLLFDLLSTSESRSSQNVFNIPLLSDRLLIATRWVQNQNQFKGYPIGFFGASTGGGAALWAASELGHEVSAVVSRGGRPDLAIPRLKEVVAPTLLIVGGEDEPVIQANEEALSELTDAKLITIPGATHLFEEPGALEEVANLAKNWFAGHFTQPKPSKVKPRAA